MTPKLSVVIPCFNEEKRFEEGFSHYYTYLLKRKYIWEIVLVNDGSVDNTLNLMQKAANKSPKVKVVTYKNNQGKGYAICQGVKKATGKVILFTDLDHSVSIETVQNFFDYFEKGYRAVIGSRRVKGSKFIKKQPLVREVLGRGFTVLVRLFIDWKVKDSTCGFKAFEREIAKKLFSKITIYDWAFDAELLFLCKKFKIDFAQAPIAWKDVRGSKVSPIKDVTSSLFGLLKIRLNDIQSKYE